MLGSGDDAQRRRVGDAVVSAGRGLAREPAASLAAPAAIAAITVPGPVRRRRSTRSTASSRSSSRTARATPSTPSGAMRRTALRRPRRGRRGQAPADRDAGCRTLDVGARLRCRLRDLGRRGRRRAEPDVVARAADAVTPATLGHYVGEADLDRPGRMADASASRPAAATARPGRHLRCRARPPLPCLRPR